VWEGRVGKGAWIGLRVSQLMELSKEPPGDPKHRPNLEATATGTSHLNDAPPLLKPHPHPPTPTHTDPPLPPA